MSRSSLTRQQGGGHALRAPRRGPVRASVCARRRRVDMACRRPRAPALRLRPRAPLRSRRASGHRCGRPGRCPGAGAARRRRVLRRLGPGLGNVADDRHGRRLLGDAHAPRRAHRGEGRDRRRRRGRRDARRRGAGVPAAGRTADERRTGVRRPPDAAAASDDSGSAGCAGTRPAGRPGSRPGRGRRACACGDAGHGARAEHGAAAARSGAGRPRRGGVSGRRGRPAGVRRLGGAC